MVSWVVSARYESAGGTADDVEAEDWVLMRSLPIRLDTARVPPNSV